MKGKRAPLADAVLSLVVKMVLYMEQRKSGVIQEYFLSTEPEVSPRYSLYIASRQYKKKQWCKL